MVQKSKLLLESFYDEFLAKVAYKKFNYIYYKGFY